MDGSLQLDRVNGEKWIFFMYIIYRNRYVINLICELVEFYDVNCRLTLILDVGRGTRDYKADVLEDGADTLNHFFGKVEDEKP